MKIDPTNHADPQSMARLAQREHPPKVTVDVGLLVSCFDMLTQYCDYASEMRKIGRGCEPSDGYGRSPEAVRGELLRILEEAQKRETGRAR